MGARAEGCGSVRTVRWWEENTSRSLSTLGVRGVRLAGTVHVRRLVYGGVSVCTSGTMARWHDGTMAPDVESLGRLEAAAVVEVRACVHV